MKRTFVIPVVVLVVTTVFCPRVASQQYYQQRSVSGGSNANNATDLESPTKSREASGRMISTSGKGNQIATGEDNGTDADSAFDNSPSPGRDSSEITFPRDPVSSSEITFDGSILDQASSTGQSVQIGNRSGSKNQTDSKGQNRWKKIPLNALVKFGSEANLASFFSKYVKNTKVVKDNETHEDIVTDTQGKPIFEPKREKVSVTPMTRMTGISNPFTVTPQGRKGGTRIETKARAGLDLAMPRSEKPDKAGINLPVCNPELTTVPVPLDALQVDPSMLVVPKCFKVKRCGGCCLSELTVCEADTKETVRQSVTLLGYDGDNDGTQPKLQFLNTTMVELEQHKTCKCKCRTKKEHCKSYHHVYEESKCSCVCTNGLARQRCEENPENRFWDNETCQCTCQEVKVCSSGFFFDLNTCDCQRVPMELETRARKLQPIRG